MTPADVASANWLWQGIIVLSALAALASSFIAIFATRRRTPPIVEELYKDFATKAELRELATRAEVEEIRQELRTMRDDVRSSLKSGEILFQSIMRSIGNIEGMLSRCPGANACAQPK